MADSFETNLMRFITANLHFQSSLLAAREMFGKSYFSLGEAEKIALDRAVIGGISANYLALTPESLSEKKRAKAVGVVPQAEAATYPPTGGLTRP